MVVVDINPRRVPIKLKVLRRFDGTDPWRGGGATEWSISMFRMVPEKFAVAQAWSQTKPREPLSSKVDNDPGPSGRGLKRDEAIGLETPQRDFRLLPYILCRLWRAGEVNERALPGSLHRLEPHLRRVDFRPPPPLLSTAILAAIPGIIMLALLAAFVISSPAPGHRRIATDRATWLAAPLEAEVVTFTGGDARMSGRVAAPAAIRFPTDLFVYTPPNRLGWVQSAGASRLVLYTAPQDRDEWSSIWNGAVLPIAQITGLTPEVIADVRRRVPDIDTRLVLVANASWKEDALAGLLGPGERPVFLVLAGVFLLPTILAIALHIRPRFRNRRLIALIGGQP